MTSGPREPDPRPTTDIPTNEIPASDIPASDIPASDSPAGDIPAGTPSGTTPRATARRPGDHVVEPTRTSGVWVASIAFAVLLLLLLIFILQNNRSVPLRFLGFDGSMPLGVAMLLAAVLGALLVAMAHDLVGSAGMIESDGVANLVRQSTAQVACLEIAVEADFPEALGVEADEGP